MNLRWLQKNLPWQGSYRKSFEEGPSHNHFAHNVLHLTKAVGKLAAAVEPLDHGRGTFPDVSKALADVVICAVRLANVVPGDKVDLAKAIVDRLHEKNKLPDGWGYNDLRSVSRLERSSFSHMMDRVVGAYRALRTGCGLNHHAVRERADNLDGAVQSVVEWWTAGGKRVVEGLDGGEEDPVCPHGTKLVRIQCGACADEASAASTAGHVCTADDCCRR